MYCLMSKVSENVGLIDDHQHEWYSVSLSGTPWRFKSLTKDAPLLNQHVVEGVGGVQDANQTVHSPTSSRSSCRVPLCCFQPTISCHPVSLHLLINSSSLLLFSIFWWYNLLQSSLHLPPVGVLYLLDLALQFSMNKYELLPVQCPEGSTFLHTPKGLEVLGDPVLIVWKTFYGPGKSSIVHPENWCILWCRLQVTTRKGAYIVARDEPSFQVKEGL